MDATGYKTIQPPFHSLKFREVPKKELEDYNRWFHNVLPQRIVELTRTVNSSPGFEGWTPSYTPDSLKRLGDWFASQVSTRRHTPEELSSFPAHIRKWVSEGELTDRTISLVMDLGMYLSQVLLRNHPSLKWDQIFGNRKFIDFGQPVLVGFVGRVPFNPVRMLGTLAYGLADKTYDSERLHKIYEIWSGMVEK